MGGNRIDQVVHRLWTGKKSVSIVYDPSKLLRKIAPETKIEKLLTGDLTLKKTALSFVSDIDFIDKKSVARVALKTIKGYSSRVKDDPDQLDMILGDPKQLIQRVQNEIIFQVQGEIKEKYAGEFFRWLPSDAEEPDPEHQLKYGETFQIGEDEMPGERIGCRCGMEILVDDSSLEL